MPINNQPQEKCLPAVYILYFVNSKKPPIVRYSLIQRWHNVKKKNVSQDKKYRACVCILKKMI